MSHNWYAVITAPILLARDISSTQKILIALISNLSNDRGYCFASNAYLAECIGISAGKVSEAISDLEKKGYLGRIVQLRPDSKEVEVRSLVILERREGYPKTEGGIPEKVKTPPSEKVKDNNKVLKTKNNREIPPLTKTESDFWQKEELKSYPIEHCLFIATNDDRFMRHATKEELEQFNLHLEKAGVYEKNPADYKRHFSNMKAKWPEKVKPQAKVLDMDELSERSKQLDNDPEFQKYLNSL